MSESNVADLGKRRQPVFYTIQVAHFWDGAVEVEVSGIGFDERSRMRAADALDQAASITRFGALQDKEG